ncbi:AAA family ATPase [Kribbella sp. VKM Ac-2566]|uniref:AAA family ATPase n=1 Tax=Kribbella sp. VKM Ac-2566 TaxID=2512218 RepID=UPI0010626323|nr:AAA family ATPase [Kribbella sp. VKM Ac-2566]TDX04021.1 adenylate kinase [Kribbella sp. VKM Ac-2566]
MRAIILAGPMAAGKTTIGRIVAAETDCLMLSFGSLVRQEAQRRGLPDDRVTLQGLGQTLLETLGARGMSEALVASHRTNVIIEGVRHVEVLDALLEMLDRPLFVYLTAPTAVLDSRWNDRGATLQRDDATDHVIESEQAGLQARAAITIDTSQMPASTASRIIAAAAAD